MPPSRLRSLATSTLVLAWLVLPGGARAELPPDDTLRAWIAQMKASPKGPFWRIRWFCEDGSVLPPNQGCSDHGGGIQHGEWSQRTVELRQGGYAIANVLAELDPDTFTGASPDLELLEQILLERFLVAADDGWIFRRARSYRGAFQAEDEEEGARGVLRAIHRDPAWEHPTRFYLLREAVRLLPGASDAEDATAVRQHAVRIADRDPGFADLRAKIHNVPDAGDAQRVRRYAEARGDAGLGDEYARLADSIDALYGGRGAADALAELAVSVQDPDARALLEEATDALRVADGPEARFFAAARQGARLRHELEALHLGGDRLQMVRASLALERDAYAAGNQLTQELPGATRRQRLRWLAEGARALYAAGLLSRRHVDGVWASLRRIAEPPTLDLATYREELRYLARVPEWSGRWIAFHFGETVDRWGDIEPLAHMYPQDRLRGSPLLFYGAVVDSLGRDANRLAGIEHRLFGHTVGAGLRALNPGLTRGTLQVPQPGEEAEHFERDGIYLLPETTSELHPVAGILTRGEGSSLSHVQLLARNLGIPNVVVGEAVLPEVERRTGEALVMAVSPGGVVQLERFGPRWKAVFGSEQQAQAGEVHIEPDLEKLDLGTRALVPLSQLRASDSGRISGPKGANLGELKHLFGDAVPDGFVIPFGVFRALLDRPIEPGGPSVFAWMKERYAAIAAQADDPEAQQRTVAAFLARLRSWIENVDTGAAFRERLREALETRFGPDGSYGVFVRSDTNVEDLPGFTGAGLNLTVANAVGFEAIFDAVRRVWASPFTERAYAWRQAHMDQPEYVFPAVLVQLAFPSEKSGVMVTADVETGDRAWLTVAVNEGVGGAVDGQAAESLQIAADGSEIRFLAQATAPERRVLDPEGGITRRPASGTDTVLSEAEARKLAAFAREIPTRFDLPLGSDGLPVPADVEFAFRDGELALLQIRPFVESRGARSSQYLSQLDEGPRARGARPVSLDAVPETDLP